MAQDLGLAVGGLVKPRVHARRCEVPRVQPRLVGVGVVVGVGVGVGVGAGVRVGVGVRLRLS